MKAARANEAGQRGWGSWLGAWSSVPSGSRSGVRSGSRVIAALGSVLVPTLGWALGGCVVEIPEDRDHPCEDVRCSLDAYCSDGECLCDPGFLGNPYALHGCQSSIPGVGCETTCGLNAYCESGGCVCAQGFLAVCGTGDCLALGQLCDGKPDCANAADEAPETCAQQEVQQWTVVDDCNDGVDVTWRLWSRDRDWAWPGPDEAFVTDGLGQRSHEEVECLQGERVCMGAQAGALTWGVGVDGTGSCEACCFVCSEEPVDLGALSCE